VLQSAAQRIPPLERAEIGHLEDDIADIEHDFGFLLNSVLTWARQPDLLRAILELNRVVLGTGTVDKGLKRLVAHVASNAAGCRYCSAHTGSFADERLGVDAEKVRNAFLFDDSPLFDDRERAALRVAAGAGLSPNAVTDEDFAELRRHFTDDECIEIVSVIALYGFFNRWNDTVKTTLEDVPQNWANQNETIR
jgi:uncharacterized peroxidase-related enzyme